MMTGGPNTQRYFASLNSMLNLFLQKSGYTSISIFYVFMCTLQKRPECKKFRKFIPTYIDFLREMYQGWTFDGMSSCIPGMHVDADGDEDADANGDEDAEELDEDPIDLSSPMSSSSRKRRSSSTTSTTTSPSKKQKNPMLNAVKGLIDTIQAGNTQKQFSLKMINEQRMLEQQQADEEIRSCLRMAKQCGATEETDEYYAATQLFEKNIIVQSSVNSQQVRED